jgi:N-alpha-acetyltransferase 35, NatC auxiliary subunit
MDLHMQVLMEMDLIDCSEFDYFYWYWDYIYSAHVHSIDKLRGLRYELDISLYNESSKSKRTKGVPPQPLPPLAEDMLMRGRGVLCKGIFRSAVLFKAAGIVNSRRHSFTNPEKIFERRFRLFQEVINPSPLSYQDFLGTVGSTSIHDQSSKESLLNSSLLCFQNARKCLDEIKLLSSITSANETNYILTTTNMLSKVS